MHLWVGDAVDHAQDLSAHQMQVAVHLGSVVLEGILERLPIDWDVAQLLGPTRARVRVGHNYPLFQKLIETLCASSWGRATATGKGNARSRQYQCERARQTASDQRPSAAVLAPCSSSGVNARPLPIIRAASSGLENSPAPRPASIAAPRAVDSSSVGRSTVNAPKSLCICSSKSFAAAPPSTRMRVTDCPKSALIAAITSWT